MHPAIARNIQAERRAAHWAARTAYRRSSARENRSRNRSGRPRTTSQTTKKRDSLIECGSDETPLGEGGGQDAEARVAEDGCDDIGAGAGDAAGYVGIDEGRDEGRHQAGDDAGDDGPPPDLNQPNWEKMPANKPTIMPTGA